MSRPVAEIIVGIISLVAALASGYGAMAAVRKIFNNPMLRSQSVKDRSKLPGRIPVAAGAAAGLIMLLIFARAIGGADRFYPVSQIRWISLAALVGALLAGFAANLVLIVHILTLLPKLRDPKLKVSLEGIVQKHSARTWIYRLLFVTVGALIVVSSGVRIQVVTLMPAHSLELGRFAPAFTTVYLVAATFAVMLLSGIPGAPNALLFISGALVFFWTLGTSEHFLSAFSIVLIAAGLGSLRFNFIPVRLPLDADGTAICGFLFSVLTVLSRQKTMAALLLALPLLVLLLVLGGLMLGLLEKTMSLDAKEKE
jgi:UDP-N-acetylmuramyl pentapeptide phosphotransferase/UDP-N-acetylglucosamine-1-phosphate transferase